MCNSFRALGAELFLLLSAALASLRFLLRLSTFLLCFVYLLSYNEMIFLAQNIYMKKNHTIVSARVLYINNSRFPGAMFSHTDLMLVVHLVESLPINCAMQSNDLRFLCLVIQNPDRNGMKIG